MAGNAPRYFFLFLIGLVVGVIGTVMLMRTWDARRDHFPESLMYVQQWHIDRLRDSVTQNKCSATDVIPHLQALRKTADHIETAFPGSADDERFAKYASGLRAELDTSLATPPLNCPGLSNAADNIGEACKACHQDFRN